MNIFSFKNRASPMLVVSLVRLFIAFMLNLTSLILSLVADKVTT